MNQREPGGPYERNDAMPMGKPPMYAQSGIPSMSPAMIGNAPSYQAPTTLPPRSQNNVIIPIGGDEDYKRSLAKKPAYEPNQRAAPGQDDRIAGVKYRPKTNERGGMSDIFNSQSDYPVKRIESRRMAEHDMNAGVEVRNYSDNVAAGMKTNSPKRKNDSSVFSHLNADADEREGLKRKDIYEIPKPKVISNNLTSGNGAAGAPYDMGLYGGAPLSNNEDELSK